MKKWIIVSLCMIFSGLLIAQDVRIAASWSTAVPLGEISKLVNTTSGRGMQFEFDKFKKDRWSLGGNFAWQSFFQKDFKMYFEDHSITSGIQRNYINSLSLFATTKYFFSNTTNRIKAYISFDIGASIIENYEIFGTYSYKELLWHFALAPGLGVDIPATKNFGIQIYLKFANSFRNNNSINYSWLNTGIGLYLIIPDGD